MISYAAVSLLMCCILEGTFGYNSWHVKRSLLQGPTKNGRVSIVPLYDIPLELSGRLDASRSWDVKFVFNGQEKVVSVPEDKSMLEMGESIFDGVDSSCRNGVCTTCAGQVRVQHDDLLCNESIFAVGIELNELAYCKVTEGRDNALLAVHGLGKPQLEAGFVCTCQCFVTGPGVTIKLGMYDQVYESQYGQFEKSYGELKYDTTKKPVEEKKKNMFGW